MPTSDGLKDLAAIARQAMIERGLQPDFPADALRQLDGIHGSARASANDLRDLRSLLWCSIDNDNSKDLDQLTVGESLPAERVKVLVAIADVDALVKPQTPLDLHAQVNTTSVYTPAKIFPMLPEKLSTDLTSLGEGEDRLALVIEMTVAADGSVQASDVYRAVVQNKAKLAYRSVAAWLDGHDRMPDRVAMSPLVGAWRTEIDPLNQWIHIWGYKDAAERMRIREESVKRGVWPPKLPAEASIQRQESIIVMPASFSPIR